MEAVRPPRVLIVEPAASGGLAAHVRMERTLLGEAGVELPDPGVRIASRPSPADVRTLRLLRRALRAPGLDAVHAHGLRAGALAALARGRRGRPPRLVVTLHNRVVGPRSARGIGRALLRIIDARADAVLTVSPDLDELVPGVPHREHAIIPAPEAVPAPGGRECGESDGTADGASDVAADVAPDGAPRPLEVLVVARLAPQKGLDDLVDALALLTHRAALESSASASDPDVPAPETPAPHVRIAGDGPLEEHLRARIAAESLDVELLGRREDVPRLLEACDLVVSSALWEGQPVFLQEALRAGRAIVATDAGGTRLVVGGAARLVPVGDPSALARAIADLADPGARERAQRAARERARELSGPADLLAQLTRVLGIALA